MKKKKCTICKLPKSLGDFNKKKSSLDGRQPHCRECNKKHSRAYYAANKKKHKKIVSERKWKVVYANQQYVFNFLKETGCCECTEKDPSVLEFDHVRGKKRGNLSTMIGVGCSLETIKKEIAKCDVRCANCHRRKTAKDQDWYKNIDTGS